MTGTQGGTIRGNLYELDYQQHFRHVVEASQPVSVNRLFYEHGTRDIPDGQYFDGSPDRVLGNFLRYEAQPHDPAVLQEALRQEQHSRGRAVPGDFKAHVTALHDSRIETEARRIVDKLKDLSAPNSPNKTHFMVEISPHFDALASTKDNDRLFANVRDGRPLGRSPTPTSQTGRRARWGGLPVLHHRSQRERGSRR